MTYILRNAPLVIGGTGFALLMIAALFGARIAPLDPNAEQWILFGGTDTAPTYRFPPTAPDAKHWLGTDGLGRDLLSRFLGGAQLTFAVVGLALAVRMGVGTAIGAFAGWHRGWAGTVAHRIIGAATSVPQLLVALVLVLLLREQGVVGFALALSLVGWGEVAGFTADRVRALRNAPHIEAARALGARSARIVLHHTLRLVTPSLLSLAALETGAVLLVLAELGVLGVFVAGATYYVSEETLLPILPLRDRAPEWGQMLAGLQAYGNEHRYIVLIPALVVSAAVFVFNVLGEGLRLATDPHSDVRLSPRTIGRLMRAGTLAVAAIAVVLVAEGVVRTEVDLAEAQPLAEETARRTLPGGELVAATIRFKASFAALDRPEMINFYFYDPGAAQILRVGFVEGQRTQMEIRPHHVNDDVDVLHLPPLRATLGTWELAFAESQVMMGAHFRRGFPNYVVTLVASRPTASEPARYEVLYQSGPTTRRNCCFDVLTGRIMPGTDHH